MYGDSSCGYPSQLALFFSVICSFPCLFLSMEKKRKKKKKEENGIQLDKMDTITPVAKLPNKTQIYIVSGQSFEISKDYSLTKYLGRGSYGLVCAAVEARTGSAVAIKKISNIFADVSTAKRVVREMELLTSLKHENIVYLHHFFRPSSSISFNDIYIVMDLYDTDLHRIIQSRQNLTNEHHQYFMFQAFKGLNYLHESRVMHRDLKPSNLLVNGDCALAICDFGMARDEQVADEGHATELTQYVVTRWYRPPEILGMGPKQYTAAVDLWSMGLIFAELLVGRPLLPGVDYISQLVMIVNFLGLPSEKDMEFLCPDAKKFIENHKFQTNNSFSDVFSLATPEATDLLSHLLVFHPAKRFTAREALMHPYLSKFRGPSLEPGPEKPFAWKHHENSTLSELREELWNIILSNSPED